jgi:hypothetical protein
MQQYYHQRIERRHFLRIAGLGGLGYMIGCKHSTEPEKNPFDNYVPLVNSQPYFTPDFYSEKDVSDSLGRVDFYDRRKSKIYNLYLIEEGTNTSINALDATLFNEYVYDVGCVEIIDTQRRYMPNFIGLSGLSKTSGSPFLQMFPRGRFTELIGRLFVSKIQENIPHPQYDCSKVSRSPFFVYRGDWSLDDLQATTNLAKKISLILSFVDDGGSYTILSRIGDVLDGLGTAIDWINLIWPETQSYISRTMRYSVYTPFTSMAPHQLLLSRLRCQRPVEENIRYLLPINEGNSWTFSSQGQTGTARVTGKKRINGKDLAVIKDTSGIEEYYGFYGNGWNYYGLSHPSVGDIFFDPAIKIGDDKVKKGSRFQTNSRIISSNPDISGTVDETLDWIERENVLLSNQTPYGDCFKLRESISITIKRGGETISDTTSADHWFAKNVGKVKMIFQGRTYELTNTTILPKQSVPSGNDVPPISPVSAKIVNLLNKV